MKNKNGNGEEHQIVYNPLNPKLYANLIFFQKLNLHLVSSHFVTKPQVHPIPFNNMFKT
jgi:hypothetical protein